MAASEKAYSSSTEIDRHGSLGKGFLWDKEEHSRLGKQKAFCDGVKIAEWHLERNGLTRQRLRSSDNSEVTKPCTTPLLLFQTVLFIL
jgi:hypothetical protein